VHGRPRLIAGAALVAYTLTGCSSTVDATAPDNASDPLCTKASRHWPKTVAQGDPREMSVDSPAVRGWGDPPIIARCGLTSPGPTTAQCIDASGVDWVVRDLKDGKAFVTYGREPAIEVLVPEDYAPEPLVLGAFAKAAKQIPQGEHQCTASGRAS
jgi:Protein of unknown function (DUF3515)